MPSAVASRYTPPAASPAVKSVTRINAPVNFYVSDGSINITASFFVAGIAPNKSMLVPLGMDILIGGGSAYNAGTVAPQPFTQPELVRWQYVGSGIGQVTVLSYHHNSLNDAIIYNCEALLVEFW